MRLNVYAASAAVRGSPSDQVSPARILYVHVRWSADSVHDSASCGAGAKSFWLYPMSWSYVTYQASWDRGKMPANGLRESTSCRTPTTNVDCAVAVPGVGCPGADGDALSASASWGRRARPTVAATATRRVTRNVTSDDPRCGRRTSAHSTARRPRRSSRRRVRIAGHGNVRRPPSDRWGRRWPA